MRAKDVCVSSTDLQSNKTQLSEEALEKQRIQKTENTILNQTDVPIRIHHFQNFQPNQRLILENILLKSNIQEKWITKLFTKSSTGKFNIAIVTPLEGGKITSGELLNSINKAGKGGLWTAENQINCDNPNVTANKEIVMNLNKKIIDRLPAVKRSSQNNFTNTNETNSNINNWESSQTRPPAHMHEERRNHINSSPNRGFSSPRRNYHRGRYHRGAPRTRSSYITYRQQNHHTNPISWNSNRSRGQTRGRTRGQRGGPNRNIQNRYYLNQNRRETDTNYNNNQNQQRYQSQNYYNEQQNQFHGNQFQGSNRNIYDQNFDRSNISYPNQYHQYSLNNNSGNEHNNQYNNTSY